MAENQDIEGLEAAFEDKQRTIEKSKPQDILSDEVSCIYNS